MNCIKKIYESVKNKLNYFTYPSLQWRIMTNILKHKQQVKMSKEYRKYFNLFQKVSQTKMLINFKMLLHLLSISLKLIVQESMPDVPFINLENGFRTEIFRTNSPFATRIPNFMLPSLMTNYKRERDLKG